MHICSGIQLDQAPGAESVAGVCLLLRPGPCDWFPHRFIHLPRPDELPQGYRVDVLDIFEHPVDTRSRDFHRAYELALADFRIADGPPATTRESAAEELQWATPPSLTDPRWMFQPVSPPLGLLPNPGFEVVSRARRRQGHWHPERKHTVTESALIWRKNEWTVLSSSSDWSLRMALAQASLLSPRA